MDVYSVDPPSQPPSEQPRPDEHRRRGNQTFEWRSLLGGMTGCLVAGSIAYIMAFASPKWHSNNLVDNEGNKYPVHLGVWEFCVRVNDQYPGEAWRQAVQAMTTIGFIGVVASCVLLGFFLFVNKVEKGLSLLLLTGSLFASVVFLLIGIAVFADKQMNYWPEGYIQGHLDYGFAFACIALIVLFVAGLLAVAQIVMFRR